MNKRVHSTDIHYIARADRARAAFVALRGEAAAARRQVEIDELPTVEFKGQTLYTIRCHGTTGKGPHDRHVLPAVLWSLIDLRAYVCPFHLGAPRDTETMPVRCALVQLPHLLHFLLGEEA